MRRTTIQDHMTAEQRLEGEAKSRRVRTVKCRVRQQLKSGEMTLEELFRDPPAEVSTMTPFEAILRARWRGRRTLEVVNARAVRSNINLAQPLGKMTERTRTWLLDPENLRGAQGRASTST